MADYVIKDETLTTIADAIRTKRETTDQIPTTSMAAEILAIAGGSTVQRASGIVNIDVNSDVAVQCGFRPDGVVFDLGTNENYHLCVGAMFTERVDPSVTGKPQSIMVLTPPKRASAPYNELYRCLCVTQTADGFLIHACYASTNFTGLTYVTDETVNYTALKYT